MYKLTRCNGDNCHGPDNRKRKICHNKYCGYDSKEVGNEGALLCKLCFIEEKLRLRGDEPDEEEKSDILSRPDIKRVAGVSLKNDEIFIDRDFFDIIRICEDDRMQEIE